MMGKKIGILKDFTVDFMQNLIDARNLIEDAFSTYLKFTGRQVRSIVKKFQEFLHIGKVEPLLSDIGYERDFLRNRSSCEVIYFFLDDLSLWLERQMKWIEQEFHIIFPPYDENRVNENRI